MREVLNGVFYELRGGCAWRLCLAAVPGGCAWRLCVAAVPGECSPRLATPRVREDRPGKQSITTLTLSH